MIAQISVVYMDAESSNLKEIMVFDGKTVVQARELPSSDLAINFHGIIAYKPEGKKEMFSFHDSLNTFYSRLYGVRHGKGPLSERGNPLLPHGLLFQISIKGSFICIIPQMARDVSQR